MVNKMGGVATWHMAKWSFLPSDEAILCLKP